MSFRHGCGGKVSCPVCGYNDETFGWAETVEYRETKGTITWICRACHYEMVTGIWDGAVEEFLEVKE